MNRNQSRLGTTLFLLLWVAALGSSSATSTPSPPDASTADTTRAPDVIATVNGQPIYIEDVEDRLDAAHSAVTEKQRDAYNIDRLLDRLINDELLAQEARAMGMEEEAPIPEQIENRRQSLALQRLEEVEIRDRIEITEDELRSMFETDYATVTLRTLTAHEKETSEDHLQRLNDGADFETLVAEESKDRYAARGGLMKDVARIDMPAELAVAAWKLEPGKITGPVRTSLGWSVIRVEGFGEADPEEFEELRGDLASQLRFRKGELRRSLLARELRESLNVVVDYDAVDAIKAKRQQDGRLVPLIPDPAKTIATIEDRTITAEQYGKAVRVRWKGIRNEEAALITRRIVIDRLVRGEMMMAEALKRGYGDTPAVNRTLRAFEKQLVVRRYIKEVVRSKIEVTDAEMRTYYEEHLDEFRRAPRIHLGQITVADEELAERIAKMLREGADLAWLAREHSTDRLKDTGGDRGWIEPKLGIDAFQDQLVEAQPGDVFGPAELGEDFVIMLVDAREEQGHKTLEEVASSVRTAVFARNFQIYVADFLERLRDRSEIELHEEVIASLRITGTEEGNEAGSSKPAGH